jgi:hypothetical protein
MPARTAPCATPIPRPRARCGEAPTLPMSSRRPRTATHSNASPRQSILYLELLPNGVDPLALETLRIIRVRWEMSNEASACRIGIELPIPSQNWHSWFGVETSPEWEGRPIAADAQIQPSQARNRRRCRVPGHSSALDLRRIPGAKSGARSAESLAPEAAEPGSGAFRKQEPLFDAN